MLLEHAGWQNRVIQGTGAGWLCEQSNPFSKAVKFTKTAARDLSQACYHTSSLSPSSVPLAVSGGSKMEVSLVLRNASVTRGPASVDGVCLCVHSSERSVRVLLAQPTRSLLRTAQGSRVFSSFQVMNSCSVQCVLVCSGRNLRPLQRAGDAWALRTRGSGRPGRRRRPHCRAHPQTQRRGCEAQPSRSLMTLEVYLEKRGDMTERVSFGFWNRCGSSWCRVRCVTDSSPSGRVMHEDCLQCFFFFKNALGIFTEISTLLKTFYFLIFLLLPIIYISCIYASSSPPSSAQKHVCCSMVESKFKEMPQWKGHSRWTQGTSVTWKPVTMSLLLP
ncbi:uncharacterized protein LOC120614244 isoform X4 [Pteropus medius]|nr:uncharacterized protein LOC120614244 isoform X4 [Pteropus giganteus]XP_039732967.1 uncharacterized protein LOC120614244 isoform X4 [Pteropus giganteus]